MALTHDKLFQRRLGVFLSSQNTKRRSSLWTGRFLACIIYVILSIIYCEARHITHRQPRLSLAESPSSYYYRNINGVPDTYSFGYDVMNANGAGGQFRNEERFPNGTVVGSYGYMDPNGRPQRFRYIADERGYRVFRLSQEPFIYQLAKLTSIEPQDTESSITWSRKRKPSKKKIPNSNIIKKRIDSYSYRPSYYAV